MGRREIRGANGGVIGYTNQDSDGRIETCYDANGRYVGYADRDNGTFDQIGNRIAIDTEPGLNYPSPFKRL